MDTPSPAPAPSPVADGSLGIGHLALHYGAAEDGPAAAHLLSAMGLTETQMLPLPHGNFYRFVTASHHYGRGDGIVYLSALPEPQARLIAAIRSALRAGTGDEHEALVAYRAMMAQDYEASFHVGFLIETLEELENLVLSLQELAESDPLLKGRISIGANRARRGDPAVDARLDASPVFGTVSREAYGRAGVQVFIETDLVRAGQLGESMVFEFDYVFPGHDSHILSIVEL
jgi:hypothetical protein